ncbi:MAG: SpoIIE family protein phosphatase [Opitutaceae bacterium]|nr:SpoIIE family protein phosphatase [Cytophagales bacterium]
MKITIKERILFLFLALSCGTAFLVTDFYNTSNFFFIVLEKLFFGSYILFTFLFFKAEIQFVSNINGFLEILWKGFLTSIVFFVLVFIIRTFDNWNSDIEYAGKSFISLLSYHLVGIALIVFQGSIYNVFKKLSFYPKVKQILLQWARFEYFMFLLLVVSLIPFDLHLYVLYFFLAITSVFSIFLTIRIKWIVYLDFRQKLQALLMISSIFLMGLYFLQLFIGKDFSYKIPTSMSSNIFIYCLFAFFAVYSLFTILILIFNLPTSGVFEKKYEELSRFQVLSDTLQQGKDRDQILELLYDSCKAVSLADIIWVRYLNRNTADSILIEDNVQELLIENIEKELNLLAPEGHSKEIILRNTSSTDIPSISDDSSLICIPIKTSSFNAGYVVIIKYVKDGFETDIINVLRMYTQQAAISLENTALLSEAIEKERYLEEIKISKHIQQSLLPKYNLSYDNLKICHYSKSTGIVGGDFFDYCTINGQQYWIAIGDVAGKGTSAAFLMAQLKGIFRSLVQVCSGPRNLVIRANYALAYNTEKSSFITLSVFLIDTELKQLRHVRAGHCQAIYYDFSAKTAHLLEPKGMGLGMLKDDSYKNFIEEAQLNYNDGDILFLYTDGVTECRGKDNKMLGVENLLKFAETQIEFEAEVIVQNFSNFFAEFSELSESEEDDVTFLVIKFE